MKQRRQLSSHAPYRDMELILIWRILFDFFTTANIVNTVKLPGSLICFEHIPDDGFIRYIRCITITGSIHLLHGGL